MGNSDTLRPAQHRALVALMAERTIDKAAASAGVGRKSLYRWLGEPAFRAALAEAQGAALAGALRRLAALTGEAVDTLSDVLDTGTPAERLRAADMILSHFGKLKLLDDIERRLAALEGGYNGQS